MFQRILVPLDGSAHAELAIPTAVRIAQAFTGTIVMLYVIAPGARPEHVREAQVDPTEETEEQRTEARAYLHKLAAREPLGRIACEMHITTGALAPALLDAVQSLCADLIVVCRHGLAGLVRWGPGSVAHKLMQQCPVPLLLLPDDEQTFAALAHHQIRALIALDGSAQAEATLERVAQFLGGLAGVGRQQGMALLLQVAGTATGSGRFRSTLASPGEARQQAKLYLDTVAARFLAGDLAGYHLEVTTLVTSESDVAQAIVQAAERSPVDMIAMTTHGRGGLLRWALGSIMERVLHATGRPLFVLGIPGE
ncbi:MAG TPA: universal stress protein [Ktedonobacteraceae bacterium]|jgi:nucleotide-binding universal stress UspA family protein